MARLAALVLLCALAGCAPSSPTARPAERAVPPAAPAADPASSAEALLAAIRARHAATWYRTLTFVQATSFYDAAGAVAREQTWFEAGAFPGRLRIDVAPLEPVGRGAGGSFLVVGDSTHLAPPGRAVQHRAGGNPLLLLGFDVVFLPAAEALAAIRALGIDTGVVREQTWEGRPTIVVGAAPGDETSAQVWFDRERLVFVRLIEPTPNGVQDIRFERYEPLDGGWIAPYVSIRVDGRLVMDEVYRAVRTGVTLPEGTFDPRRFPTVPWWTAAGYDGSE